MGSAERGRGGEGEGERVFKWTSESLLNAGCGGRERRGWHILQNRHLHSNKTKPPPRRILGGGNGELDF